MPTAVIVDAVRTPQGRRNGALKDVHPVDLAALTLDALIQRTSLDPELVEDVIMGCVMQVGDQAVNVGRNAALAAGFPESTVGTTVDRQCGSSQQAAHFAAQGVIAGAYDVVVAAGVESMTRVPMGASFTPGSQPFGPKVFAALPGARRSRAPGDLGRAHRREVGHLARGQRSLLSRIAPARRARHRRGALRAGDHPGRRSRARKAPSSSRGTKASGPTRRSRSSPA